MLTVTQLTGSILVAGTPQSFNVRLQSDVDNANVTIVTAGFSSVNLPVDLVSGDDQAITVDYDGSDLSGQDLGGYVELDFLGDTEGGSVNIPYETPPPMPSVYGFLTFTDPATLGQSNPYLLDLAYFNFPQYTWLVLNVGQDQTYAQLADSNPTSWNGYDNLGGDTPVGPLPPGTYTIIVTVTETDTDSYWFGTQGSASQDVSLIGPSGRSRTRRCSADLNIETYI